MYYEKHVTYELISTMKIAVLTIPALLAMTVWNCPSETFIMVINL